MPNVAAVLKDEIVRLSGKSVRRQVAPLRSAAAMQRRSIATLRRQLLALQREVSALRRSQAMAPRAPATQAPPARFIAKGLISLRRRLGLSATDLGTLIGVSALTVYSWENKKSRPRADKVARIGELRALGKREAQAMLAQARTAAAKPRKR